MSDLTEFAPLSLPELTAELERMQRTLAPFTPTTAGTSRDVPEAPPLGRAVAGNYLEQIA